VFNELSTAQIKMDGILSFFGHYWIPLARRQKSLPK